MEIGWCNLPNCAGYIANRIHYPQFTADMVDWWFAWHPREDLRYRIWYPPQHAGIMLSPIDRARILDDSIPMREKNWGVVHNVTENCDCGYENIDINSRSPAAVGFDVEKFDKVAARPSRAWRATTSRSRRAGASSCRASTRSSGRACTADRAGRRRPSGRGAGAGAGMIFVLPAPAAF